MKPILSYLLLLPLVAIATPDPALDQTAFEGASAGPWEEVFFDCGTVDWREKWFLDGEIGAVETTLAGMRLSGGPRFWEDAHHTVLWTKDSFKGDLKIEYDYTRLDFENRAVNILFIQATGSGSGPYARDISEWSELRKVPAMRIYFNNMHLYHISYAAFPLDGIDTTAYIRGRRYIPDTGKGLAGTDLQPDYFPEGLFEPGVPHHITVIKRDGVILMRIENAEQIYYCKMSNPELPTVTEGRIGLRHMYTRSARYNNFRVSALQ